MRWPLWIVISGLSVTPVFAACECPEATLKELEDRATQIFTGRVIEFSKDRATHKQLTTFEVDESFKGDPPETVTVRDDAEGGECALKPEMGLLYVVYTRWQWGDFVTGQCFGTKKQDLKSLEPLGPADSQKEALYPKLENACRGHKNVSCCLASVAAMRKGHYLPAPDECPEGSIPDRLRCFTSYTWCIPTSEAEHRHHHAVKE